MPFTPFHFGLCLPVALGDVKYKRIDVISSLLGSIIVDIEPILILILNLNLPLHGPLHSFLGAIFLGIIGGIAVYYTRSIWNQILKPLKWEQTTSLKNKIFWCILMANIHVLFDAMIYPEMNPLTFILGNPFYGFLSTEIVYSICIFGIIIGLIEYLISIKIQLNKRIGSISDVSIRR